MWSPPSGHCSRLERGREIEKGMEENEVLEGRRKTKENEGIVGECKDREWD